ncbi:MAG: polynucleotide kinase-phosphatase [Alphaproteobacteria bacterium]|nr:polynucleotide kinase-phosphatase [Alphaproteobacteria bacterium]
MSTLRVPQLSLVVLIGVSGAGKSSFARRCFRPTQVLSSDTCRGWVSDDEEALDASEDAFELLHFLAGKRLARGLLTVVDATSVRREDRASLVALAKRHHALPVAIVLDVPPALAQARNAARPNRDFGPHVVRNQHQQLRRGLRGLDREGFRVVHHLEGPEAIEAAQVELTPMWPDKRHERGPFDIIGDVHGCRAELDALLTRLGYQVQGDQATPPEGRRAVFLGDLVDRGPDSPGVLRLVMNMVAAGHALTVPGNHDVKLVRALRGRKVKPTHGLAETLQQLEPTPPAFKRAVADFLDGLVSHLVLDGGALVVAHAGMKASLAMRASARVRAFALYGETHGETDEYGLPVRHDWADDYRGEATVVYGHVPVPEAIWHNRTICLDTGCVFGGQLTALRWPERALVSVPAAQVWYAPARPLTPRREREKRPEGLLDLADVAGKRVIRTRLLHNVTLRPENTAPALEQMSRFAADPRWLIHLPPTMSPPPTAPEGEYLEHPRQAFAHYLEAGVGELICQQKHMGSRALLVLCRDAQAAARRFRDDSGRTGMLLSRTGRNLFTKDGLEAAVLERLRAAATRAGLWERLDTDWMLLDAELMPWSVKARELLRSQYAPVAAAGEASLDAALDALQAAAARGLDLGPLLERTQRRRAALAGYRAAYRGYCWPVNSIDDLEIAPFHLLAAEGRVFSDQSHLWHVNTLSELVMADTALLTSTPYRLVTLGDPESEQAAVDWWLHLTEAGGEGMVVKPLQWLARSAKGIVQPAMKVRGREYLRLIYGPEYTEHLEPLRRRGLSRKQSLARREFALGLEALYRFVEGEPLYRVHECVFGVMALECEAVDPRL